MAYLHNELNYINSKQLLTRTVLTGVVVLGYAMFIMEESARDYKDSFDLKYNQKIYGSIADSSGEGASSMDDWSIKTYFEFVSILAFKQYISMYSNINHKQNKKIINLSVVLLYNQHLVHLINQSQTFM